MHEIWGEPTTKDPEEGAYVLPLSRLLQHSNRGCHPPPQTDAIGHGRHCPGPLQCNPTLLHQSHSHKTLFLAIDAARLPTSATTARTHANICFSILESYLLFRVPAISMTRASGPKPRTRMWLVGLSSRS